MERIVSMPQPEGRNRYPFDEPRTYRIRLIGQLNESWSDRLGGMRITTSSRGDRASITTLVGCLRDQAELAGVLNALYELHLTLLSVEILDANDRSDPYPAKPEPN
jgi:hypothetical protein